MANSETVKGDGGKAAVDTAAVDQLKKKFDPNNLFRLNQNVDPAG